MAMTDEQIERYSRHIILKEVGAKGQKKLLKGKVLIIGAGGLGAPAAMYLAAAGVGTIGIVDADEVDLSNLQRQIIHSTADIGKAKVKSAKETMNAMNPDVVKKDDNKAIVTVGAGVSLGLLAQKLLKESIGGFEFASGIPGTIGGAVRMNAGAYGGEFKDIVISTKCIDITGNIIELANKEQNFSYRHSAFMNNNLIIIQSKLMLDIQENQDEIKQKMDENLNARKSKQPINMPNAGSTFKRGSDFITAKLIDECGLKGYTIGGAQISDVHAGFVVNTGNATAEDVLSLVDYVKNKVYEKFKKEIQLEVEVIGE